MRAWLRQRETGSCLPGTLVPRATNVTAVTASLTPTVQPKCEAMSPMKAVRTPTPQIDTKKHKYPPHTSAD